MKQIDAELLRFIDNIPHAGRREDARVLLELMQAASGEKPKLRGSTVGYGNYHYVYESGRKTWGSDCPHAW
jgi:hypothetical protein